VERLSDDFFTDPRTVGVCCVNKIDPQFDSPTQNLDRLIAIRGRTPDSVSGDAHCSESQPRYTQVIPDQEFAGIFGRWPS
jgi:hypothetical protein